MSNADKHEIVARETLLETEWFNVVAKSLAGGDDAAPFYCLELDDYVSVVALTEDGSILLVKQFRATHETITLELPSGHVDPGELPEAAARRELLEETGHEARDLVFLGSLMSDTGRLSNRMWCYFVNCATAPESPRPIEAGLECVRMEPARLKELILNGGFEHALNMAPICLAQLRGLLSL